MNWAITGAGTEGPLVTSNLAWTELETRKWGRENGAVIMFVSGKGIFEC